MPPHESVEILVRVLGNRYLTLALRLILGSIFILAGFSKLSHQAQFVALVSSYELMPAALAQFYATILPWLELAIGVCLIIGLLSRFVAGISMVLIFSFIVANGISLYRGVTDECGCFGQAFVLSTSQSAVMDLVMFFMAWQITFHRAELLSCDSWLRSFKRKARVLF